MQFLNNLAIGTRSLIAFGLMIVLTCTLGLSSFMLIRSTNQSTVEIGGNWLPGMKTADDMKFLNAQIRAAVARTIIADSGPNLEKGFNDVKVRRAKRVELMDHYEKDLIGDKEDRANFDALKAAIANQAKVVDGIL